MVLVGQKAIADALGLPDYRRVNVLRAAGAPVRVLGRGRGRRYLATLDALLRWIERRSREGG